MTNNPKNLPIEKLWVFCEDCDDYVANIELHKQWHAYGKEMSEKQKGDSVVYV